MPGNVSQKVEVTKTIKNATSLTSQMFNFELDTLTYENQQTIP